MGLEIERRFIVKQDNWKEFIKATTNLKQGYLIADKNKWTIRVRIINSQESLLTLKHPKDGIIRYEYEYSIPLSDGLSLWEMSTFKLSKTRHLLNLNNNHWIVDCFHGDNFPLVMSEIELEEANQKIEIPNWCNIEVSDLKEFSNAALAKLPISKWPIEKKRLIL